MLTLHPYSCCYIFRHAQPSQPEPEHHHDSGSAPCPLRSTRRYQTLSLRSYFPFYLFISDSILFKSWRGTRTPFLHHSHAASRLFAPCLSSTTILTTLFSLYCTLTLLSLSTSLQSEVLFALFTISLIDFHHSTVPATSDPSPPARPNRLVLCTTFTPDAASSGPNI
ncbi:hypothetical protein EDB87DRAFT_1641990 [Lactarius vividus]|nr:hypothetical protein EDB87DRAFT_1641990 [Lactarius vividus]